MNTFADTEIMIKFNQPQQVRICRHGVKSFSVVAVWGLMETSTYSTTDWREFLKRHEWEQVPRVWDVPRFK